MRCDDYECLISAFADGELDEQATVELQDHLAHCEHCRRIYAETWALQHQLSVVFLSPSETPDMEAAVLSRIFPSKKQTTFTWAWAAAAAVLLAMVCTKIFIHTSQPIETTPAAPTPEPRAIAQLKADDPKHTHGESAADKIVVKTPKKNHVYYVSLVHKPKPEKKKPLIAPIRPAAIAVAPATVTVQYEDNTPVVTEGFQTAANNVPEIPRFIPDTKPGGGRVSTVCAFASDPDGKKIRPLCYIKVNRHEEDPL